VDLIVERVFHGKRALTGRTIAIWDRALLESGTRYVLLLDAIGRASSDQFVIPFSQRLRFVIEDGRVWIRCPTGADPDASQGQGQTLEAFTAALERALSD
jgi:hypothetical protein